MDSDAARFREFFERHFEAVSRYARARADPDTAKDAVAQAFLVAWRRRPEFFGARHQLGWLLGVTRRALADERRAAGRQSRLRDPFEAGRRALVPAEAERCRTPRPWGDADNCPRPRMQLA